MRETKKDSSDRISYVSLWTDFPWRLAEVFSLDL